MLDVDNPHPLSRIGSAVIAALYVGVSLAANGLEIALRVFMFCLLPLACIWFPRALGDFVGGRITASSPASFVWVLGWVVLLLPVIVLSVYWVGATL